MIYFDNAATTKVYEDVIIEITKSMEGNFANPSSLHKLGYMSEQNIIENTKCIANYINASEDEIYFTSGATESNNIAIFGALDANKRLGNKVITTKIEHASIMKCFNELENRGYEVIYLDVDANGHIDINDLINKIDENTALISIMYVNNEIGTIQKIDEIGAKIKAKNKNIIFHTDAVQAFGKIRINTKNIDLISVSGHKIHAQKGIGFLYIKKGVKVNNIMFGAGQQKGIRPGTINTEGIAGITKATKICYTNLEEKYNKMKLLKDEIKKLETMLDGVEINGDKVNASPYILSMSFKDIKAEILVYALEEKNIFVSTRSACASKSTKKLTTIDYVAKENTTSTIRISFCDENDINQAKEFNQAILEIVPKLRIYKKG